ncbi:hypothetical protein OSB04_015209 [Centaurea solstitialis]|uniref:PPM-type phosphatase domain-containing protein n=1 Tax=Centaurea solstitialis TaxID=347529 RepID=A0AA38WII2_9ASTR|nr:hypothetical protein OSB04_015209 [Centaurea solstitialis]
MYLASNPVQHQRTKHVERDLHFVRERVAIGHVRVLHVPPAYQYADIFTKGLPTSLFLDFRNSLNILLPLDQTTRSMYALPPCVRGYKFFKSTLSAILAASSSVGTSQSPSVAITMHSLEVVRWNAFTSEDGITRGDAYMRPWVIPSLEVKAFHRTTSDECMVIVTDGLWDVLTDDEAAKIVLKVLQKKRGSKNAAQVATNYLLRFANPTSPTAKACSPGSKPPYLQNASPRARTQKSTPVGHPSAGSGGFVDRLVEYVIAYKRPIVGLRSRLPNDYVKEHYSYLSMAFVHITFSSSFFQHFNLFMNIHYNKMNGVFKPSFILYGITVGLLQPA